MYPHTDRLVRQVCRKVDSRQQAAGSGQQHHHHLLRSLVLIPRLTKQQACPSWYPGSPLLHVDGTVMPERGVRVQEQGCVWYGINIVQVQPVVGYSCKIINTDADHDKKRPTTSIIMGRKLPHVITENYTVSDLTLVPTPVNMFKTD